MSGIVLTFPILAGKVEAWRRFCQELLGSRRKPYEASRQRLGITREQLALVDTAFGATAVTTLESPMWPRLWDRSLHQFSRLISGIGSSYKSCMASTWPGMSNLRNLRRLYAIKRCILSGC